LLFRGMLMDLGICHSKFISGEGALHFRKLLFYGFFATFYA